MELRYIFLLLVLSNDDLLLIISHRFQSTSTFNLKFQIFDCEQIKFDFKLLQKLFSLVNLFKINSANQNLAKIYFKNLSIFFKYDDKIH